MFGQGPRQELDLILEPVGSNGTFETRRMLNFDTTALYFSV